MAAAAAAAAAAASVEALVETPVAVSVAAAAPTETRLAIAGGSRWRRDVECDAMAVFQERSRTTSVVEDARGLDAGAMADPETADETLLARGITVPPNLHLHPFVARPLMIWNMNLIPLPRSRLCPLRKTTKRCVPRERRRHEIWLHLGSTLTDVRKRRIRRFLHDQVFSRKLATFDVREHHCESAKHQCHVGAGVARRRLGRCR